MRSHLALLSLFISFLFFLGHRLHLDLNLLSPYFTSFSCLLFRLLSIFLLLFFLKSFTYVSSSHNDHHFDNHFGPDGCDVLSMRPRLSRLNLLLLE